MSIRKRNAKTDRLSELPDSLIFDIFGFLPMTDVVRTTILSKRWKSLWTTVPFLNFSESRMLMTNEDKIRNLVNEAIRCWRGTKIMTFHVEFDSKLNNKSLESDVDLWMHFATEKKVEELVLYLPYRESRRSEAKLVAVPECIYSCSSLKDLRLSSCDLQIQGNVQWSQLINLEIDTECLNGNMLDQVLLGSPQLEYLSLSVCGSKEKLNIRSTSLKWLSVRNLLFYVGNLTPLRGEVRIWTPSLECLMVEGVPFSECLLLNVSSLIEAHLLIDDPGLDYDVIGEAMINQILPTIKHVSVVILSNYCIKVVGAGKEKHMVSSPFPYAELLELKVCCEEEYKQIVDIVVMCPKLRELVIETSYKSPVRRAGSCFDFDINGRGRAPFEFPWQLRTVDISWSVGDESIFVLMEILLKYAKRLKQMVLQRDKRIKSRTRSKSLIMVSQKLLGMQRSFPAVELIFC